MKFIIGVTVGIAISRPATDILQKCLTPKVKAKAVRMVYETSERLARFADNIER